MKNSKWLLYCAVSLVAMGAPSAVPAQEQDTAAQTPFECAPAPEPVVSLSIGSRYQEDSETRSDISEESNEDVDQALEPVETFITDLSGMANAAYLDETDGQANADCVMDWLSAWAEGNALTELNSLNARLAVSPRLAGLALAYLQAQPVATPDATRDELTIAWFETQAEEVIAFFETEAGPLASTNNLRAWAALALASIGRVSGDEDTLAWARESYKLLVCGADESGALPAEMERGERALHYQLHALAPLVVTQQLLDPAAEQGEDLCRPQLDSIVEFTLAGIENPGVVEDLVGSEQVFSGEDETVLAPYQLAWAEPYLQQYPNAELEAYIKPLRPLSYSKLGGDLTAIYAEPSVQP